MHRDIKVENILIAGNGLIKLADFGLAKKFKVGEMWAESLVGTPGTLSPERIQQKKYDKKSDIWGLGCVMYELMTKNKPFLTKEASSIIQLYQKIVKENPLPLPVRYSE